ncbi:hypothetical protein C483_03939 [Natrialba hulunbeirensis JCM 10989]|uniref:Uncharacterized protein n=1 Tax=Natrialba hulunbeirensis JCM 10989 TaxID=1227493 RepID=M0A7C8_9EURY|nr:hypothetical protein C483_03939 [Natrialba hulunbeirensis JCM 10989]
MMIGISLIIEHGILLIGVIIQLVTGIRHMLSIVHQVKGAEVGALQLVLAIMPHLFLGIMTNRMYRLKVHLQQKKLIGSGNGTVEVALLKSLMLVVETTMTSLQSVMSNCFTMKHHSSGETVLVLGYADTTII